MQFIVRIVLIVKFALISNMKMNISGFNGVLLDCRSCDSAQTVHPECFPIPVPIHDPYFPPLNSTDKTQRCLALVRSLPGQLTMGMIFNIRVGSNLQYGINVVWFMLHPIFSHNRTTSTNQSSHGICRWVGSLWFRRLRGSRIESFCWWPFKFHKSSRHSKGASSRDYQDKGVQSASWNLL